MECLGNGVTIPGIREIVLPLLPSCSPNTKHGQQVLLESRIFQFAQFHEDDVTSSGIRDISKCVKKGEKCGENY